MKAPKKLKPLLEDGLIDEIICQLISGKEAQLYVVRCGQKICCAKVYKEKTQRNFKQATVYREGRKVKNSRRARAMEKSTRYGQQQQEKVWQYTEVNALHQLAAEGVRVPKSFGFIEGVLLMELITVGNGKAAPRLNDIQLSRKQALAYHSHLMTEVVRMLCAGLIHGDLSEYNVLVDSQGPVIIDFPQVVNAAGNNSAYVILQRDINNLTRFFARFAPELDTTQYAQEIWHLYEQGNLHRNSKLTGRGKNNKSKADVKSVMQVIEAAAHENKNSNNSEPIILE